MKKIKLLALVLAVLTVISCFAACGGGGGDETQDPGNHGGEDGTTYYGSSIPTNVNFKNLKAEDKTVNILVRSGSAFVNEMDCDSTVTDTVPAAVYRRNRLIEKDLGVIINRIPMDGNDTYAVRDVFNVAITNDVLGNTGYYDAAAIYAKFSSGLVLQNNFLNLYDTKYLSTSIKDGASYINKALATDLTFDDTLYFLSGDITTTAIDLAAMLVYNKDVYNDTYGTEAENLYQLVADYKWTIDKFAQIVSDAYKDLNNSGRCDSGDIAGVNFCGTVLPSNDSWMASLGVKITEIDEDGYPVLAIYENRAHTMAAYEKFNNMVTTGEGILREWGAEETSLNSGNMLFQNFTLGNMSKVSIENYGVLPLPMYNEEQREYRTTTQTHASLVVMMSSLKNKDKKNVVDATLEAMSAASAEMVTPVYRDQVLKGQKSQSPDDAKMFDVILGSIQFGFGNVLSYAAFQGTELPDELFREFDRNIPQFIDSYEEAHGLQLDSLIITLMELALQNAE